MAGLIDTHVHLEQVSDWPQSLARAFECGVEAIIAVGSDDSANRSLLKIYREYRGELKIHLALGIHPGNLDDLELTAALKFIEQQAELIVAIGEIGLDYWYKQAHSPGPQRSRQIQVFQEQLDLALCHDKPVIVHSRGAWGDCLQLLSERKIKKALFHWYSGPEDILKKILQQNYLISASPSAEYSPEHRRAITHAPIESIILETDSPVRYKSESGGYISQPKDVFRTLAAVAKIKNITPDDLTKQTTANAVRFFNLKNETGQVYL